MDKKSLNIILIILTILVAIAFAFSVKGMKTPPAPTEVVTAPEEVETPDDNTESQYINVFFIGQNKNKEEVYKAVKRKYDPTVDGTSIKFAITALIDGPKPEEVQLGVYSEIPVGTRLLSIVEAPEGVYINLSKHFDTGGGTDSIYKRIFQLIKTAKYNTTKPVYLLIENQPVEVLGGEGIMITQPLNENSLGG